MYQVTVQVPDDAFRIVVVSDLHIGTKGFREDLWDEVLDELKQPNTYWISLGDVIEGRAHTDSRMYDVYNTTMTLEEQYEYFFNSIQPYTETCLGMVVGNHEYSHISKSNMNPLRIFCNSNKIRYLGYLGRLVLKNKNNVCRVLVMHGAGGGAKAGSAVNRLNDYAVNFMPDVSIMGHHHKFNYYIDAQPREDERNKISYYPCHNIMVGSLLDGYKQGVDSYAERLMMAPTICSYSILHFNNDIELLYVSPKFGDA